MFDATMPFIYQPAYWFDLNPGSLSTTTAYIIFGVFALFIMVGVFFRVKGRQKNGDRFTSRLFRSLAQACIIMGCLGFLLLFFSFEQISLFGARFWYLFWVVGLIIWLGIVIYKYFKIAPREKLQEDIRRQREKYLPKKKK